MAVKPEFAHVRGWDEATLTLSLGWDKELTTEQVLHQMREVKDTFLDMPEVREAHVSYSSHPGTDGARLQWRFIYDEAVVGNDTDSQRQALEQRIEAMINTELFGRIIAIETGP